MLDNDQDAVVRKTRKSEYNAMARLEVAVGEMRETCVDPIDRQRLNISTDGRTICLHRTVPYRTVPYRTVPYRTVPYRTVRQRQLEEGEGRGRGRRPV
jgi:hypothetical protein